MAARSELFEFEGAAVQQDHHPTLPLGNPAIADEPHAGAFELEQLHARGHL